MNVEYYVDAHLQKFWEFFNREKSNLDKIDKSVFPWMFHFIKNNKKNKESEFLQQINDIEDKKFVFGLYETFLSNIKVYPLDKENDEKIISFFEKYFLEKKDCEEKCLNIFTFLCKYFQNKKIEIDYFYQNSSKITFIFRVFNFLNKNKEFEKMNFYINSKEVFEKFIESIDKNEISFNQLKTLIEVIHKPEFDEKLQYFDFRESKKTELINKIESKYKFILEKQNIIKECKNYLEKFPSTEDSKIKNSINLLTKDNEKPIKKFIDYVNGKNFSEKFEKLYERGLKYNKIITLKMSSIFINELENKIDKELGKLKYLEKSLLDMKKILSIETLKEMDTNILNQFLSLFEDEDELIEEINNLKKYLKYEEDTVITEKYLKYKLKDFKLMKTLNSFDQIISLFNLVQTQFYEEVNQLKEKVLELNSIEDNFEEEHLEEKIILVAKYISSFEALEPKIKLKIIPMDLISFVVNKFQENNLAKFLFDLTINDLRDITNSLAGSSLDINDIDDYMLIKTIINALKEKAGINENEEEEENKSQIVQQKTLLKDVDFLEAIPLLINEKLKGKTLEDFKNILAKCSKNQPKLLVLFENKKGFETSKEDIRNIINESTFEIYDDKEQYKNNNLIYESRYNCRCIYKEHSQQKYLKELVVLQQLASLSQNKEKEEENKILNIFIDLIESIKDILSIVEKIIYKGFPEEFYYRISIKEGNASCQNMNIEAKETTTLYEEKTSLKKLLKKINKSQIDAYKNYKFLKFFYGQQLTLFNDYLKKKVDKRLKQKEVSNLIYYIIGKKFKKVPQNFLYQSSLSSAHEFKINNEEPEQEGRSITLPNINIENDQNEEIEISTKAKDDTSSVSSGSKFLSGKEMGKKRRMIKNLSVINFYKRTSSFPLMKQGTEEEMQTIMKDMYKNVEKYLNQIMSENNITEEDIFEKSKIRNEKYKEKRGLYIFNSGQNIYKYILKFYHCLVGNDPPRFVLLLCNDETSLEEFLSFIYLAIFCPYHSLFIIAKPDKLRMDIIYEVESSIEKIYENEKNIKSYILLLFNDIGKTDIGKELLKICKSADDPKEDLRNKDNDEIITSNSGNKDYYKNIEVVISSTAGYGKSYYIQKTCKEKGLIYIPFPIGGEIKRQTIMRRLKELNLKINENKYGLHFDFSDTRQTELFEDFIFSFLIQKVYSNNENIFCYEDNVIIYIEIQNGFFNLMEKFKLFYEFNIHIIDELPKLELQEKESDFKDFEDMAYDKEKNLKSLFDIQAKNEKLNHNYLYKSDIQLVCNYLKHLEEMSKKNIFFYNLNEISGEYIGYNYIINSKYIKEEECRKLLDKYFTKNNKSYHQIDIYIKVLADQLRRFSTNFYLMIENLVLNYLSGEIRKDVIQAFLDLTNFFTAGAFDNIISEQNSCIIEQKVYYDEEEANNKAADKLSEEKPNINFNELKDKGFIFINKDGQSLTIITCASKDSDIYKRLDKLYNSTAKSKDDKEKHINIPDFTKMEKNDEYLEVIRTIVDSREDLQTIKQKLGSYVFNADNFFKMVQILLRFRAGIPVLIMGETGCGKTSLINAIAEINNYKMLTFNVHAGVNDNEIVQFMMKNNLLETDLVYDEFEDDVENLYSLGNEEDSNSISVTNFSNIILEKEKSETEDKNIKKIVFFDEFNTSNSLG